MTHFPGSQSSFIELHILAPRSPETGDFAFRFDIKATVLHGFQTVKVLFKMCVKCKHCAAVIELEMRTQII